MTEETLFHEALARPAADRAKYLDQACTGRPDLRAAVEALLAAHDASGRVLDRPAAPLVTGEYTPEQDGSPRGTADYQPPPGPALGSMFAGRFKLRELIGEGGMGVVYVADQIEPVQRRVALKVIRGGADSSRMLARFEQERQALAVMDHPNIAKVYDAGIAPEPGALAPGVPYFVMELIKGVPITTYCNEAKLTPRERLELFVPVCQAVQHAHQKGIIHRDLKPSNILVGLYDGKPVPKVIDFGVAKATGPRLSEHTVYTEVGSIIGTIEYMSPEQAELNNLDIDTRSDIYALGVILYELLTGTVPFSRKELQASGFAEMLRIIKEKEPPKPSTRLSQSGELPSVAAQRQTEPAKLSKLIRGDLDWITMKALEKDRSRRYETANGFAMDVQRYLAGDAVLAAPPSAAYRMRKFVKRNKGQVIAASLILGALVGGLAATLWQSHMKELARQDAVAAAGREADERRKAEEKEAEANAVVKFFEDKVFAAGRPKGEPDGLGHEVSLKDAVAASLPALATSFRDQPLVEARLRNVLGQTFHYLGEWSRAAEQFAQTRALLSRHRGPDHQDTLSSMNNLAVSYAASDRHAEAVKLLEEALAILNRVLPPEHPSTLQSMNSLANSYRSLNRHAEAVKLLEKTLAIQKRVLPPDHHDTLMSMNNLALSYQDLNRHAEALKLQEEELAAMKRVLPDHPDTLQSMNNLAVSYRTLNRHAESVKLLEEALAAQKRMLPPDHPRTLSTMGNLANGYAALNRHADAIKLSEETLAAMKRALPPDHRDTLLSMHNLGLRYVAVNRHAEAIKLYEEALAGQKRVLPPDHQDTLRSMHNLARVYAARNRHAEAVKLFEETLAAVKRVLPPDHPNTLKCMINLANSYAALNRHAEALPLLDELLAKSDRQRLDPSVFAFAAIGLHVQCCQKLGDLAGCRASAEMFEKRKPADTGRLYDAACYRAVTAALQSKAKDPDAARLAKEEADKAMAWLHKAVAAGYKDADHMKTDTDLDALREREDFKKLIAEIEKSEN